MTQSRSRRIAIAIAASLACFLIFAAMASAYSPYEDPPVKLGAESANLPDTTGLVVENSPRKIAGVESNATTEALYEAETETSPDFDSAVSTDLRSETDSLLSTTDVWDWGLAPEVTVGFAGGWIGWEIGSAIWATFFKEKEEPIEAELHWDYEWSPTEPGQLLFSDSAGTAYAPDWGFVGGRNGGLGLGHITESKECESLIEGDGVRIFSPGFILSEPVCSGTTHRRNYRLWRALGIVRCGVGSVTCPGIEPMPYEGANQPTAPTAEALRKHIGEELVETTHFPYVNRFLNHEHEPENFPDPRVTKEQEDHRCDRSTGAAYENLGGNGSPEPFAKKIETPFTVTNRPEGVESTPIYLRWGTTFWEPGTEKFKESEKTPYIDLWGGWGYRHILAKHGWSALDREETELALTTGTPKPAGGLKYRYETPEIAKGVGSVPCTRVVIVQFETGKDPQTEEEDPAPRGIVTSFNEVG